MSLSAIKKFKYIIATSLPFVCLLGIVILQGQEYKKLVKADTREDYLNQEKEQARFIGLQQQNSSLGFDNLAADLSYLNFVQYFGDRDARETIGYSLVPDYFEVINKIDPRFTNAHLTLSIANSMYAGDPGTSISLMEKALNIVEPESKDAALLWTSKGLDELLFFGDKDAAIKSYKTATKWAEIEQAIRPDGLTIKDLEQALENTGEIELKETQIRAWSSVLVYIKDKQRSREIINKINVLKAEVESLEKASASQSL